MGNLADHIRTEIIRDNNKPFYNMVGKCVFATSVDIDKHFNLPHNHIEEIVKGKIIAHLYGNILKELNYILRDINPTTSYNTVVQVQKLIEKIINGEITDDDIIK